MNKKINNRANNFLEKNCKAQSEMVGFALIIIIVAVVLLVFLSISVKNNNEDTTQSFEVESYLQSVLDYTTECADDYVSDYYDIRKLIFACSEGKNCLDGSSSCDHLNTTLKDLAKSSWEVGEIYPNKGYSFKIEIMDEELLSFSEGNITNTNKGSFQSFEDGLEIIFVVYS
ncbi:MAG: hypothetical protein U9Q99_02230 [Nanoarchaeota archaeon]|nr:hypothetical protein [Nanoarchaeota archaeon]